MDSPYADNGAFSQPSDIFEFGIQLVRRSEPGLAFANPENSGGEQRQRDYNECP
jgi:hypothetical protein